MPRLHKIGLDVPPSLLATTVGDHHRQLKWERRSMEGQPGGLVWGIFQMFIKYFHGIYYIPGTVTSVMPIVTYLISMATL